MNNLSKKEQYIHGPAVSLLNSGNWNADLHPRDSNGEFTYTDEGLHGRPPSRTPSAKGSSAIRTALALPINQNTNRKNGTATNPYFSHYSGATWDPNKDYNSGVKHLGFHNIHLTPYSLAISANVAKAAGLTVGGPVYVNGNYLGNYDDQAPENNTIDVYDPDNAAGSVNWGGTMTGGATISPSP